ncbi:hypothetical protein C1925_10740 [Stenotrophomonas sp. SAU14A_NAIMI4_5]|uniref:DUF4034 domain-containing protein n=1 Tax=Stenotrophomonas sp. SAU14A_NAIMI4_5 TaxID=2072413 RepID=UPI000D54051A|nr:DUF4034 domain-containing protein [Stenotrophomonas sp. SAU14A_NAIMI4_5]AWH49590.1 hypothetical protein C1925_10740 [Stenotrophomonas sp. SAU14A_NAIMI4_5]
MRSPTSPVLSLSITLITLAGWAGTAHAGPSLGSAEYAERNFIQEQVDALLRDEDFDTLEALAKRYRRSGETTTSGTPKLTHFYDGFSNLYEAEKIPVGQDDPARDRLTRWVKRYPRSPTPHLALASALLGRGMAYRGYGYSSTVSPQDSAQFHDYTEAASAVLKDCRKQCASDPNWYARSAFAGMLLGWDATDMLAVVDEGMARYPGYVSIPFQAAQYFSPKWGGTPYAVESTARRALETVPERERPALYARIYWSTAGGFYKSPFAEKQVDWPLMSQGIDDVLATYPSDWNLQNFAYFACQAKDKAKTRTLMDQIKQSIETNVWWEDEAYYACWRWSHEAS